MTDTHNFKAHIFQIRETLKIFFQKHNNVFWLHIISVKLHNICEKIKTRFSHLFIQDDNFITDHSDSHVT